MELIVISESKLKITLTPPDMVKYALEGQNIDRTDGITRKAFRQIFRDVRAESGFDTEGHPLFIQLYASKGGGCEIFVTKLEEETYPEYGWTCGDTLTDGERRLLEELNREEDETVQGTYRFTALSTLLAACRRLTGGGYRGESAVYITAAPEGDIWYLSLEASRAFSGLFSAVGEYGEECETSRTYLAEHGRVICHTGAVELLGEL